PTHPGRGCASKRPGAGPRLPLARPASRTRPASRREASACETVGLDRSLSRAICARETGPIRRTNSRTDRSLIARRRLGVPPGNVSSILGPSPPPRGHGEYSQETFLTIGADATLALLRSSREYVGSRGRR